MMNIISIIVGIIAVCASQGSNPAHKYLEQEGKIYVSWLKRHSGELDAKRLDNLILFIKLSIASHAQRSDDEMYRFANSMKTDRLENTEPEISRAAEQMAIAGNMDLMNFLDQFYPGSSQAINISFLLGLSGRELDQVKRLKLTGNEFVTINNAISKYMKSPDEETTLAEEIAHQLRLDNFHKDMRFWFMSDMMQGLPFIDIAVLEAVRKDLFLINAVPGGVCEKLRNSIFEIFEFVSQFSPENVNEFARNGVLLRIHIILKGVVEMLGSLDESKCANLIQSTEEIGVILNNKLNKLSEIRSELIEKVRRLSIERREPTLFLVPKLISFIQFATRVDGSPVLLKQIVSVSIEIIEKPPAPNSLMDLSGLIDFLFELWSNPWISENSRYTNLVIEFSSRFAFLFGKIILPTNLLPQYSESHVKSIRAILESFLQFDGPLEWKKINASLLLTMQGSEDRLKAALPVLGKIHEFQRTFPTHQAPLLTRGVWLLEFLKTHNPSPYSVLVSNHLQGRPRVDGQLSLDSGIPKWFFNEADLIDSAIGTDYFKYSQTALNLPRELLVLEANAQVLGKMDYWFAIRRIELCVEAYLELIMAASRYKNPPLAYPRVDTATQSIESLKLVFFQAQQLSNGQVDPTFIQSMDGFVSKARELTGLLLRNADIPAEF